MKTRTAALGIAGISLVGLVAGLSFFSSSEEAGRRARLTTGSPTASAAPDRAPRATGRATTPSTTAAGVTPAVPAAQGSARSADRSRAQGEVVTPAAPVAARGPRPVGPRRPGPKQAPTGLQVSKLRASLTSSEAQERLAAVRYLRTVDTKELLPDVRALLQVEACDPVRRVAAQLLAQTDPAQSVDALTRLRDDPDAVVRINAAYGLARAGDVAQQLWLLGVYDAARLASPRLVPVIAAALEDPAMRAPAVVARFQAIVDDPSLDPAHRAKAARVLRTKLGA